VDAKSESSVHSEPYESESAATHKTDGGAAADPGLLRELTAALDGVLYRLQHRGLAISSGLFYRAWSLLLRPGAPGLDRDTVGALVRRFEALLARDLANVERGVYPRSLLYQMPLLSYARTLPEALFEMPRILWRRYTNRSDDVPEVGDADYPSYYLRNFHWQSDGWLSERSARLYDPTVEFLFGGVADVMRRMAVAPLVERLRTVARPRVLDVACGTGRFLTQLSAALPAARLYGIDLSPYYVRHARKVLKDADAVLACENAERMPWADETFDAVASIFLFHELPPAVRRTVAAEMARVVAPGGWVVLCDSAQLSDSAEIESALTAFPESYHEPFYRGYLHDDLEEMLERCGLVVEAVEPHLVSKVVVARRPSVSQTRAWSTSRNSTSRK
jgi:ubiquinone/menaquinone biosynthesis C-methylase UbiE